MSDTDNRQPRLGISGKTAQQFLTTQITPLLALVGVLLGVFAVLITPREEEPQINVTFANVFIPFPGATSEEIANLVTTPAEQVLTEIKGIKHVYSISRPGMSVLTVEFQVGEDPTDAIVRLYSKVFSNQDWLPRNLGVGQPIIKPKGIDDVPIVTVTLWSEDDALGGYELGQVAHALEAELKRVQGTRNIYTLGSPEQVVKVEMDPQALAGYHISLDDLRIALQAGNSVKNSIPVTTDNREILVQAGTFLSDAREIGDLVVGSREGRPVFLRDVAKIHHGSDQPDQYVWFATGAGSSSQESPIPRPAVTIAVAKKAGSNAVDIANSVINRLDQVKGIVIPDGVETSITRNYGQTADDKAQKLIGKLIFATGSVVLLVLLALGWREAMIVGTAVMVTLLLTLFASWAWGFTLNRVSLFALIFSIGILVDDAIVVVENIHRHLSKGASNILEAIPKAVNEVGGPTILATFTVIAALLPMAFVTGLMGPYMSPIPINASMGMLISLVVAFILTPWMSYKFLGHHGETEHSSHDPVSLTHRLFHWSMSPFLGSGWSPWLKRAGLFTSLVVLIVAAGLLVYTQSVVLKMLPFDNKSEFQVVLDMPEGSSLEQTTRVLAEMGEYLAGVPEVSDYQAYAGTASPINFNGLVRQYYLREGAHLGDIQVNLVPKDEREHKSHEIALSVRLPIQKIASQYSGNAKIVEVPPGPPVFSPLVAEVYGIDYQGQIKTAKALRQRFEQTADIIDIDDSVEYPSERFIIEIDRTKAARHGITQNQVTQTLSTLLSGEDMGYLHGTHIKYAVPIRAEYSEADKADLEQILNFRLHNDRGDLIPLSEIVTTHSSSREHTIYHKDLLPVVYVTADMAGETDSPLYGLLDLSSQLNQESTLPQQFISQPENPYEYSIKWDGEWQITYETFRDMGIAYSVGLLLIYLLVVAQFRSYLVPLVIMAPIPMTLIGIMPGHALLDAQFTATSMIGMIALAGIIVRNSILLVDYINQQIEEGVGFEKAVIDSAIVRAKPITLTALAAMAGAFFILDDPIFKGLAVSLIFGLLISTLLTLVVIPLAYYEIKRGQLA
ncbi:MAG: efflux RND transporter permease subunit [Gammaproteobacteria bacterium]|nr:efflux RND transporter permease subunit [Gammaproteobacteria bacterium]